ncbi:uncharacterized protein LOC133066807 [Dama dama]|uniref:uncharacterized protein LOC133066807 n=1 Tax=Dama dama TaxID=30532 RepID=UPI002A360D8E|nr:uncharacterized protein LOC133066807 [Dama dama]
MFPSAVTALTGAGRSQSPERAGRERARFGERESESARGAGPRARESAGGWGAESGRGTPTSGRRRRAAGGERGGCPGRPRGGVGARRQRLVLLCGARDPARLVGRRLRGKESTSSRDCGGGLGPGAELHRESWNSWRVRGGVSARLRSARSGKEPAQPKLDRGTLQGARVAPDWLGERGASARETRTQAPPSPRQKQSPAEPGSSSFVRDSGRLLGLRSPLYRRGKGSREPGGALETCVSGTTANYCDSPRLLCPWDFSGKNTGAKHLTSISTHFGGEREWKQH